MLCDACKKNEATVHLTQIIENKMQTFDLCEACSKTKGLEDPTGFSLASLLLGIDSNKETQPASSELEAKCPQCGFSLSDFKKAGRLGCPQCYTAFAEPLDGLLKSMHKGTQHVGKVPRSVGSALNTGEAIRHLQTQLDQAIKCENFEQAAQLRDQIKQLKTKSGPA
jgi:protein arginine kinase activator